MNKLLLAISILFLASCNLSDGTIQTRAEKKLARLVKNHPELVARDTVWAEVRYITNTVYKDTTLNFTTDTITVTKENLTVKVKVDTVTKKIFISGEVKSDTVFVNVPVEIQTIKPVEVVKIRKPSLIQKIWWLIVGAVIGAVAITIIRFGKKLIAP
jgi:hypothetical protein